MLLLNALNIILPIAALLVGLAVGYFITSTLLKKAVTKEETALLEEAKEKAEVIKKERTKRPATSASANWPLPKTASTN